MVKNFFKNEVNLKFWSEFLGGKILVKLLMNKIHILITYYDFSTQNEKLLLLNV